MKKILTLTLLLLVVAQAITNKEILQTQLDGLFEANNLPKPTTIVPCFDDDTAKSFVDFEADVLKKGASGSVTDIVNLIPQVLSFLKNLPQPVQDCLDGNKEGEALGLKYGITPDTEESVIVKKFVTYATLHFLQVHKWLTSLNDLWNGQKYYQIGYDGAGYLHNVLGAYRSEPNLSDKEIIQQFLNGLFEQNKLADPTTVVPCLDDDTAHKIVVFVGQVLEKAAHGSVQDIISLKDLIKKFGDEIPQPVKDCLDGNKQFEALGYKYGITPDRNSSAIEKKVIAFITLHYLEVHRTFGTLNDDWKAGKYYQAGWDGAAFGHKVLGSTSEIPNLTDKEIIQQGLNGLFEQNKLPDPTTIVPCIDDDTAHKIVVFGGQLLQKAARGSVQDIISLIDMVKKFGDEIPQSVKDCLDGNKELETLGLKYGITPDSNSSAIQKKVITYVTLHYLEVHKTLGTLND